MIVFSAFVPHTPLLTPILGKDHAKKLKLTLEAIERVREELYASHPEVIVVISTHDNEEGDAFSINLHDTYHADLKEFGDLTTHDTYQPDLPLIDDIQRSLRKMNIPLVLHSHDGLSHGASVPLIMLTKELKQKKIIPISCSNKNPKAHVEFGRTLKSILAKSDKRIAVVASGDLSHALRSDSPMGFKKEGEQFDELVQQAIANQSLSKLLSLDADVVEAASECAYRPLLVLLGALDHMNTRAEILSYESPFGVGHLVATFHLS